MRRGWLAFFLFAAGVALVIVAIFWSLYAYGQVGQMVASKGLRPASSFRCLMAFGGSCDLLAAAHAKKGTIAYTPLVFWAGVAAVIASFVAQPAAARRGRTLGHQAAAPAHSGRPGEHLRRPVSSPGASCC